MDRSRPKNRRSKSSQRWLARQRRDPYARRAAGEGLASRAYFKLAELDRRLGLVRPDSVVLELGAAPGGWTGYVESKLGRGGLLIACDPLPVTARPATRVITGSYGDHAVTTAIVETLGNRRVDLVLSDMAPNITGVKVTDQARVLELAELSVDAAERWMKPGGSLVVKIFQGAGVEAWTADTRKKFAKIRLVKPKASRPESREMYAVGQQFLATG